MNDYKGSKYRIIHCEGALESFNDATAKHPKDKRDLYKAQMIAIIKRLGDGDRMSNENFPQEGELPDKSHFRALKKIPIRAYIWLSKKTPNTYYISHYIYKNYDKLKKSEIEKVCNNWKKIEE
jgi:hypothetical protein